MLTYLEIPLVPSCSKNLSLKNIPSSGMQTFIIKIYFTQNYEILLTPFSKSTRHFRHIIKGGEERQTFSEPCEYL